MATNISTITINAPLSKVWDVITLPAYVKLWQFGSELITDWKAGSSIRFKTAWEDKVFEQWGQVLEVVPGSSIKYSLFAPAPGREDIPENYFVMNYFLSEENGHTKLSIIQEDNRPNAVQEEPQGEENAVLQLLKSIAEGN